MATHQIAHASPSRFDASAAARYDSLREELKHLRIGREFKVTFLGRYSARCGRNSLAHFCRHRLKYTIEVHQTGNVLVIKRTA